MEKKSAKRDTEGEEGEVEKESLHKYNTVISMDSIARDLFEYRLISNSFFCLYVCVCNRGTLFMQNPKTASRAKA